jgi:hypothetical protein
MNRIKLLVALLYHSRSVISLVHDRVFHGATCDAVARDDTRIASTPSEARMLEHLDMDKTGVIAFSAPSTH